MAAGPISERNQGDCRERVRDGSRGARRSRLWPPGFSRGAGDWVTLEGVRPVLVPAGGRMAGFWLKACRCDALYGQSSAFPLKKIIIIIHEGNLQQNSTSDLRRL